MLIKVCSAPHLLSKMTCTFCGRSVLGLTVPCDLTWLFSVRRNSDTTIVCIEVKGSEIKPLWPAETKLFRYSPGAKGNLNQYGRSTSVD